jgi:hypothetical protein
MTTKGPRGVRLDPKHLERTKAKIQVSQIVNRLQGLVNGTVEMPPHAVTAALGLLRKMMPDMSAVEQTGDAATFVMRLPEPAADTKAWEANTSVAPTLPSKVTH